MADKSKTKDGMEMEENVNVLGPPSSPHPNSSQLTTDTFCIYSAGDWHPSSER